MLRKLVARTYSFLTPMVTTGWTLLLLTMTVHVVGNGILRKFFRSPIEGTNEITQYWYMPLIAFGGFIITEMRNEHIEARIIYERMPRRVQQEFQIGARLLVLAVCGSFAVFTFLEAVESFEIGLTGGVINLTIWPVTFAAPIAFGAMTLIGAARLVADIRTRLSVEIPGDFEGSSDPDGNDADGRKLSHDPQ